MVCGTYLPDHCGVSDYTRRLVKELRTRNVEASVITTAGLYIGADPDVPAFALAEDWTVSAVKHLARKLQQRRPDLVHIQFPTWRYHGKWGVNVLPRYLHGLPVVTTLHEYCMAPPGGRAKQLLSVFYSRKAIVTQEEDWRLLARWFSSDRLSTIPIGSNIDVTADATSGRNILASLAGESAKLTLLFFGFVRPGKGLETLFQALSLLPSSSARLLIVAPDPDPAYGKSLEEMALQLGIAERIFSTGYLSDAEVSSIMQAVDGAVLPFEDGATSRRGSLLAALAHGLPVLTTRSERTPASFVHKVNMLLSPVDDAKALAANIRLLLECPALKADISHGAELLSADYAWAHIAQQTHQVYKDVLGRAD